MKEAILYGAGDLRLEERPLDLSNLKSDEIYVETEYTAMSTGTDLGNFEGRSREVPDAPDYPRKIGYSNVGVVVQTGIGVHHLQAGQRVFSLKPQQSAFIAHQDEVLVPVPDRVRSDEASLAYLSVLGLLSLQRATYQIGENVAVVGLGVIGLATVALVRAIGARVVGIANSPIRAQASRRVGAHAAFLSSEIRSAEDLRPIFGENGADVVILTANTWDAYHLSVEIARKGGRIALLGFPGRAQPAPGFNPLDAKWVYMKNLTLCGVGFLSRTVCQPWEIRFNTQRNLEYVLSLLESRAMSLDSLITHRFRPENMVQAYDLGKQHSKELIAAVFDWRNSLPAV